MSSVLILSQGSVLIYFRVKCFSLSQGSVLLNLRILRDQYFSISGFSEISTSQSQGSQYFSISGSSTSPSQGLVLLNLRVQYFSISVFSTSQSQGSVLFSISKLFNYLLEHKLVYLHSCLFTILFVLPSPGNVYMRV